MRPKTRVSGEVCRTVVVSPRGDKEADIQRSWGAYGSAPLAAIQTSGTFTESIAARDSLSLAKRTTHIKRQEKPKNLPRKTVSGDIDLILRA